MKAKQLKDFLNQIPDETDVMIENILAIGPDDSFYPANCAKFTIIPNNDKMVVVIE